MVQRRSIIHPLVILAAFLSFSVRGEVVEITGKTFNSLVDGNSGVLLEFYAPWCGHCKRLAPEYEILGKQFSKEKDGVMIAKVDATENMPLAGMFGVSGYPTLKWMPKGSTMPNEAEDVNAQRSADGLANFINEKIGKPLSGSQAPSDVLDLTDDDFDSIALDPSKDVLVEFFAPWCGHCKALAPVYEKLGTAFAAEKRVEIAKVDATKNKDLATRFEVTGFPSIKFFPRGDGEIEHYEGGRDLKSMVKYINEKAGTSRTPDGGLGERAGLLPELDAVLKSAKDLSVEDLKARLDEAIASAGYSEDSDEAASAGHYSRAVQKMADRGSGYIDSELKRLEGMLAGQGVSQVKRSLFIVRSNILRSFAEHGFGGAVEDEGAKDEL